jgi:hypothetical protein
MSRHMEAWLVVLGVWALWVLLRGAILGWREHRSELMRRESGDGGCPPRKDR